MTDITSTEFREVADFVDRYGIVFKKIMNVSKNISFLTLHKITKNVLIADVIFSIDIKCDRYFDFDRAFAFLDETRILVNIEELDLYLIFENANDYSLLMKRIYSNIIRDDYTKKLNPMTKESECTPYQIVLSSQRQKIVFLVNGSNDDINSVRNICKEIFNCENVLISTGKKYKEITVQLMTDNLSQSITAITRLKDTLHAKNSALAERIDIRPIDDRQQDNKRYYSTFLGKPDEKSSEEFDFKTILKYLPEERIINFNIIHINGSHVNIGMGNFNNIKNDEDLRKDCAIKWIAENLPENGHARNDLYNSYKVSLNGKIPVASSMFNGIICELGYTKSRNGNIRTWIMK